MTVRVWDIVRGKQLYAVEDGLGKKDSGSVDGLFLCSDDTVFVAIVSHSIKSKTAYFLIIVDLK